jgi:glycosyltransferase involved in cell wall biosynthesis
MDETSLHVAFACGRESFSDVKAGDIIQMQKARDGLEEQGVEVTVVERPTAIPANVDPDILHVFNLPYSGRVLQFVEGAVEHGIRVALSPVYWDFSHSHVLRFLKNRFGINPHRTLKPVVPALFSLYRFGRAILRPDANFDLNRSQFAQIVDRADLLLPNSTAELHHLAEWTKQNPSDLEAKTHVVYNAVDTELFEHESGSRAAVEAEYGVTDYLLQVGAMFPNKNQLSVLEATADLDVPVVFVGRTDSPYASEVQQRAANRSDVRVIGEVPHEDLKTLYSAAAAHALPSFRESPGLVSLEAALCRCELVISNENHCPVNEYFGDNAHVCDPYSVDSIRDAIRNAMSASRNDETFRSRLRSQYSWKKTAEETLSAYKRL